MRTRWSLLIALAVLVAACSPQSSIVDNIEIPGDAIVDKIEIPSDAIYCGRDSQVEPPSTFTFSAQTCVKTTVESGEAAWMLGEVGPEGSPAQVIILVSADGTMRRYGVTADGEVLVDDVCDDVVWNPVGDQEATRPVSDQETIGYAFSPLQCRDV